MGVAVWDAQLFETDDCAVLNEVIGSKVPQVKWLIDLKTVISDAFPEEAADVDERLKGIRALCESLIKSK